MKIYSAARVHAVEQTEAFAVARSRSARRKKSTGKNRSRRNQTALDWARNNPLRIGSPADTQEQLHPWAIWNWEQDHPAAHRRRKTQPPEPREELDILTVEYLLRQHVLHDGDPPPDIPGQVKQHFDLMVRIRALQSIGSRWAALHNHCNHLATLANRQLPKTLRLHPPQQDNDTGRPRITPH